LVRFFLQVTLAPDKARRVVAPYGGFANQGIYQLSPYDNPGVSRETPWLATAM